MTKFFSPDGKNFYNMDHIVEVSPVFPRNTVVRFVGGTELTAYDITPQEFLRELGVTGV